MSSMVMDPNAINPATGAPASALTSPNLPTLPSAGIVASTPALQLSRNPMLPQAPLGAAIDSQYAADAAALRTQVAQQYQDILKQLGYVDPDTGQFVMGSVEANAQQQQADLQRSLDLADEQTTQQHQGLGTLFSGLRGTDQARAEYPYVQSLSQLATQTPLTLSDLYEQGANLISNYNAQNNQLLASAAARAAQAYSQAPPADTGTPTPAPAPAAPPAAAPVSGAAVQSAAQKALNQSTVGGNTAAANALAARSAGLDALYGAKPVAPKPNPNLVKPVAPGRVTIDAHGNIVVH
jgi:hypothetical protein